MSSNSHKEDLDLEALAAANGIDLAKARANPRLCQRDFLFLLCALLDADPPRKPRTRSVKHER